MELAYTIKFVADMDRAITWHRDVLNLKLAFQSPFWSEFDTGPVRLALHAASEENAAGLVQLGFRTEDIDALYADRERLGLEFVTPPKSEHGTRIARLRDCEGAIISVSSKALA